MSPVTRMWVSSMPSSGKSRSSLAPVLGQLHESHHPKHLQDRPHGGWDKSVIGSYHPRIGERYRLPSTFHPAASGREDVLHPVAIRSVGQSDQVSIGRSEHVD